MVKIPPSITLIRDCLRALLKSLHMFLNQQFWTRLMWSIRMALPYATAMKQTTKLGDVLHLLSNHGIET